MPDRISPQNVQPQLPPSQQETAPQSRQRQGVSQNATNAVQNAQSAQAGAADQVPARQVFAAASNASARGADETEASQFRRGSEARAATKRRASAFLGKQADRTPAQAAASPFERASPERAQVKRGSAAPGKAADQKPAASENAAFRDLQSKSKVARAFMHMKPTLIMGKVRANTKVVHQDAESVRKRELKKERYKSEGQNEATLAKKAAIKEGKQWAQLFKTGGKLAALAVRNDNNRETGKYGNDPASQLNKASPGRWLAKSSMNKVFNTETRDDLKKSFAAYLDSTRPGSSINIDMATNVKWGPRIPIGAIVALPVGPTVGLDANHDRTTGFKIERQDDGNFSIKLKYDQADGAGLRASVAPDFGTVGGLDESVDNSFLFAAANAGGSHKEERSLTIKDQSLERTAEFFNLYMDHDISKDQGDDAVHGKKSTNKFAAWAAFGPGGYADSLGEANMGGFATVSVGKELGGKDKTYKLQDSHAGDGTKVKVEVKTEKVKAEHTIWNGDASTDAGFGWGLSQIRDGVDWDPRVEPSPEPANPDVETPKPETGQPTGSYNITTRHQNFAGEGTALTRNKNGSDPKDKKVSVPQADSQLLKMSAKRSTIPTRKERWTAEGSSGLKPESLFGEKRAAKIMAKAISTLKEATGEDYDVRKRNLKFNATMTVKPEAFDKARTETIQEFGHEDAAELKKKLKTILANPKKFHDDIDFSVSMTESKTYGQGAKFGIPFLASVMEKADITFSRSFELGIADDDKAIRYSQAQFEEAYGRSASRSAPEEQAAADVEVPDRYTISTPPGLETIPEEDEGLEGDAAAGTAEATESVAAFSQQDMDDIFAPMNKRD
ncbi:hypothetical protein K3725_21450 (plasmid) [Leisingera sp. S132]|uniref:hypothetical protein n=1 Tax=Leisingera sp. S132 TaxID=2867016 RepID=UPI0021A4BFC0|nr:hypothetical protein [Leisingera sp. S132]UWQ81663.1 hypothetical protein K3725_21450 [Leisingera sp. S132]